MNVTRRYFDDGLRLDPQTKSDLIALEKVLQSGFVKVLQLGASNLIGIEEVFKATKKMKEYKRPITVMMWRLQRLSSELHRGRCSDKKMRLINWHVDDYGMIAYFSITTYWRKVANSHLRIQENQK